VGRALERNGASQSKQPGFRGWPAPVICYPFN
jgi:hypothetical protein